MVEFNSEFRLWNDRMFEVFGDRIPMHQIPTSVTNQELFDVCEESIKLGRNLLPERYGFSQGSSLVY